MKLKEEYLENLINTFRLLDFIVFPNNTFPIITVDCLTGRDGKSMALACFGEVTTGKTTDKVEGEYQIAKNIKSAKGWDFSEKGIMSIAVHEIRHRVQSENPNCLLVEDFILPRNPSAEGIFKTCRKAYISIGEKYYQREADAWIIQSMFENFFVRNFNLTEILNYSSDVISIMRCTPNSYDNLINDLKSRLVK